ncbi:MAG: elongation factor Ts, partial [Muribaculaceae bacterium]|nr:elongation factor Ts [Muribaculaceae bacterium]MBJ2198380.1 elongation factor Ts [Muribaculaceae bacterium]
MAVSIEDIKKLRNMTGAGMMDCKNALAETEGDIQAAIEIIRKKGQAVA